MKWISKSKIEKGWSCDEKYCVTDETGTRYLLRITPREKCLYRQEMFQMQQRVAALGVPMCRPVEFGTCEEGVYTVQTWINGVDAEAYIPALPAAEQYAYGRQAGEILQQIHTIPAPDGLPSWEEFNRIVWCAQSTPAFACGMVDGYFPNGVPMLFWQLLALYISSNSLSSVPWAIPFGEKEIQVMLDQAEDILSWYDNMEQVIPSWYREKNTIVEP